MRNGSEKRPNYNKKSKKIDKVYLDDKSNVIRTEQYYGNQNFQNKYSSIPDDLEEETYDDYYDLPSKTKDNSTAVTVIISSVIIAVLAMVVAGLSLMKPREHIPTDLVIATTSSQENAEAEAIREESESPVIYGINPIIVYAGNPVAYKAGVYVEDDTDDSPVLEIDNEMVDLSTPGTYMVTYIARDKDDNETREQSSVTVLPGAGLVSEDKIYELADKVLSTIIPDDTMTDEMKCLKVYEYLHAIGYVDEVHSQDWMQNAYWMLTKREGDCFCYYSAARLLLSRLGYEVMEVRNNNNYVHYWCLVSLDGGNTWWHFDPCCWSWGEDGVVCLVSDKYLSEFTRRHKTSDGRLIHAWDLTKYPATPLEDFWTDQDRAVIYESGVIDPNAHHDPNDEIWANEGWEHYQINYEPVYTEPVYIEPEPAEYYPEPVEYDPEPAEYYAEPAEDYVPEEEYEPYAEEPPADEASYVEAAEEDVYVDVEE